MGTESTPIFGVLRRMPTAALAGRLNWSAYRDLPVQPFSAGGSSSSGAEGGSPIMGAPQRTIESFFQLRKKARA